MKITDARATLSPRTLDFLRDAHKQMKDGDDMPRMVFTAMSHYLTPGPVLRASATLGIIERFGWRWKWTASAPTKGMAEAVVEEMRRFGREQFSLSPRQRARARRWSK